MRAEHLYKRFGDKPVLEDVSLTVPEGAVVCLMAPSGWGKTTLLRCMAGLEKPDSGTVRDVPERIGYVFQEDRLCGHMSAVENVRLPHATVPQIKQVTGLDAEHRAQAVREAVQAPEAKGEAKV